MEMDREKVIKALDLCSNALYFYDPSSRCNQCPYRTKDMTGTDEMNCSDVLMADALALLKEQEPKQVEAEVINEIDRFYRCPSCHISMLLRKQPYCHSCGQAVKWE